MTELEKDFGGVSVRVLDVAIPEEVSSKRILTFDEDIKNFISDKIGEFSVKNRFRPIDVNHLEVEAVDSLATGEGRFSITNRKILWKELYPLGIIEFEKIWTLRKQIIPPYLKKEKEFFLFEGTEIIRKFDKKAFYLAVLYQQGRIFRDLHPAIKTGDLKSLVVKRYR